MHAFETRSLIFFCISFLIITFNLKEVHQNQSYSEINHNLNIRFQRKFLNFLDLSLVFFSDYFNKKIIKFTFQQIINHVNNQYSNKKKEQFCFKVMHHCNI